MISKALLLQKVKSTVSIYLFRQERVAKCVLNLPLSVVIGLTLLVGSYRGISDNYLPKRLVCDISIKNEELSRCVL